MNAIRDGNEYGNESVQGKDREEDEKEGGGVGMSVSPPPSPISVNEESIRFREGRSQGSGEETL